MLDVGCGQGEFLDYFVNKEVKVFAVDRDYKMIQHVQAPKSLVSIDSLPFANKSIDIVTCLEVIEHLPHGLYESALGELSRVADKYALITVPFNQDLKSLLVQCPFCYSRFNRYLHIRSFDEESIRELLVNYGWVCSKIELINKKFDYHFPLYRYYRLLSDKDMPSKMKCPICGYEEKALRKSTTCSSGDKKWMFRYIKNNFKKILPKKLNYSWIAGLYERENG